jgi:hypothetical protein
LLRPKYCARASAEVQIRRTAPTSETRPDRCPTEHPIEVLPGAYDCRQQSVRAAGSGTARAGGLPGVRKRHIYHAVQVWATVCRRSAAEQTVTTRPGAAVTSGSNADVGPPEVDIVQLPEGRYRTVLVRPSQHFEFHSLILLNHSPALNQCKSDPDCVLARGPYRRAAAVSPC